MLSCEPFYFHPRGEVCVSAFLFILIQERDFKEFIQLITLSLHFMGTQLIGACFLLKNLNSEPATWAEKKDLLHLLISSFLGKGWMNISQELDVGHVWEVLGVGLLSFFQRGPHGVANGLYQEEAEEDTGFLQEE